MNIPDINLEKLIKCADAPASSKKLLAWGLPCDFVVTMHWIGGVILEVPSENSDRLKYQYIGGRIRNGVAEVLTSDVEYPLKERASVGLDTLKKHAPSELLWVECI